MITKLAQFINAVKAWPKHMQIGAGVVALGAIFIVQSPSSKTIEPQALAPIQSEARITTLPHDLYNIGSKSVDTRVVKIRSGDSLGPVLQKNGVSPNDAHNIAQSFSKVYDPRYVRVGQTFGLSFVGDELQHVSYKPSVERTVFVDRLGDNEFSSREVKAEFQKSQVRIASKIENSLYLDANALGAPDKVIQQFANIYEYSVDFQRDIHPGDEFELFFDVQTDHRGNIVKAGDLLYTRFNPRGKELTYYLYQDSKGRENFYDEKGKTAKRKLRATPVNGARISSTFGKRRHPILGYVKNHKGVDFAAPRGTPIMAAGAGKIERASRYGGYGKYIRIKHSDGYKTAYAHLSNYARGIKKGKYVTQDQIIGYVGTTGRSTGPHLHYEVLHNGKHINPRRLSQLSGKPLAKDQMSAFKKRRDNINQMRGNTPLYGSAPVEVVADISAASAAGPISRAAPQ